MEIPETKYARSGDVSIAYQILGEGPIDLVWVSGIISNIEYQWFEPRLASFLERASAFSRLIRFDKRGTGISDRVGDVATLDQRMDDIRAVMDAAGSERAVLFGSVEGGPMAILFAATYPDRTAGLVLWGSYAKSIWAPDYPWGLRFEEQLGLIEDAARRWGTRAYCEEAAARVAPGDEDFRRWWGTYTRLGASPTAAAALMRMNMQIDVRDVLPMIGVPTLIMHRNGDLVTDVRNSHYLATNIPGARYVELEGAEEPPHLGDSETALREIERFVAEVGERVEPDRMLATVVFTDIVESTRLTAELGDSNWRELIEAHNAVVRGLLARFRGKEVDTAGDGFLATFDGPTRAVECAREAVDAVRDLGLEIRAGLHTGECAIADGKVRGLAVHIGARVLSQARPGEVLVSQTVKDLVAGSGLEFEDRGAAELKGVPGEWRLYAVAVAAA
jgi:class 3 adenylate cyclase